MLAPRAVTVGLPLDPDHVAAVVRIQERLGVPIQAATTHPHVSLAVVLGGIEGELIDAIVAAVAATGSALVVNARGFGVFEDHDRGLVLHVPVVRTVALSRLQDDLFDALTVAGASIDGHYRPSSWFPHVTLWTETLTPAALCVAVGRLAASAPIAWTLPLTCLARFDPQRAGDVRPYRLGRIAEHAGRCAG